MERISYRIKKGHTFNPVKSISFFCGFPGFSLYCILSSFPSSPLLPLFRWLEADSSCLSGPKCGSNPQHALWMCTTYPPSPPPLPKAGLPHPIRSSLVFSCGSCSDCSFHTRWSACEPCGMFLNRNRASVEPLFIQCNCKHICLCKTEK